MTKSHLVELWLRKQDVQGTALLKIDPGKVKMRQEQPVNPQLQTLLTLTSKNQLDYSLIIVMVVRRIGCNRKDFHDSFAWANMSKPQTTDVLLSHNGRYQVKS